MRHRLVAMVGRMGSGMFKFSAYCFPPKQAMGTCSISASIIGFRLKQIETLAAAQHMITYKFLSKLFLALIMACFLSGCGEMFAKTITVAIGAAQETHEYYLRYSLDFQIGDYTVRTDDIYEEVVSVYENFSNSTCNRSRPECWNTKGFLYVVLPNGDIVALMNEDEAFKHSLPTLNVGVTKNITLNITDIYRNRKVSMGLLKGKTSCLNMLKDDLSKNYGLSTTRVGDLIYGWNKLSVPIQAKVERIDAISDDQQDYLDWSYKLFSGLNKAKNQQRYCEQLIAGPNSSK